MRFNNDQVLEEIVKYDALHTDSSTEKLEEYFEDLCKKEILRNIAQNLTTVWYKTFDPHLLIRVQSLHVKNLYHDANIEKTANPTCNAALEWAASNSY